MQSDKTCGVSDKTCGVSDKTCGVSDKTDGVSDKTCGVSDKTHGVSDSTGRVSDTKKAEFVSDSISSLSDTDHSASDSISSLSDTDHFLSDSISIASDTAASVSDTAGSPSDTALLRQNRLDCGHLRRNRTNLSQDRSSNDRRWVTIKDEPIRRSAVRLLIHKRRFFCRPCGRPFTEPVGGIIKGKRTTERYARAVQEACADYVDLKTVRQRFRCSGGYLYSVLYRHLELRLRQRRTDWPERVDIDEHFFKRGKGFERRRFVTMVVDQTGGRLSNGGAFLALEKRRMWSRASNRHGESELKTPPAAPAKRSGSSRSTCETPG